MNFSKLKKAILEIGVSSVVNYLENGEIYDDYDDDEEEKSGESKEDQLIKEIEALGLVLVHEVGGNSGDGEDVERIFVHRDKNDGNIYIKITGFYSSYEGTEWDEEIQRVMPETHTVTIYTKYKN